jgi:hypothetical protein
MPNRLTRAAAVIAFVASLGALAVRAARACEPSPCAGGIFLSGELTIPPNAPGIPFWPSSGMVTEPIRIERQNGATWSKVKAVLAGDVEKNLLLVAAPAGKSPWAPGRIYRLSPNAPCPYQKAWAGRKGPLVVTDLDQQQEDDERPRLGAHGRAGGAREAAGHDVARVVFARGRGGVGRCECRVATGGTAVGRSPRVDHRGRR